MERAGAGDLDERIPPVTPADVGVVLHGGQQDQGVAPEVEDRATGKRLAGEAGHGLQKRGEFKPGGRRGGDGRVLAVRHDPACATQGQSVKPQVLPVVTGRVREQGAQEQGPVPAGPAAY